MEEILSRLKGFNPPDRCTVEDREAAEAIQGAIAEIERLKEIETSLEAWQSTFRTSQLSHAKERLDRAEKEAAKGKVERSCLNCGWSSIEKRPECQCPHICDSSLSAWKSIPFPDPAMAIHNEESEKGLLETIKSIHADPRIVVRILEVEDCAGCPRNDGEICGLDTEVSTKSFLDGSFPARCPLEVKRT